MHRHTSAKKNQLCLIIWPLLSNLNNLKKVTYTSCQKKVMSIPILMWKWGYDTLTSITKKDWRNLLFVRLCNERVIRHNEPIQTLRKPLSGYWVLKKTWLQYTSLTICIRIRDVYCIVQWNTCYKVFPKYIYFYKVCLIKKFTHIFMHWVSYIHNIRKKLLFPKSHKYWEFQNPKHFLWIFTLHLFTHFENESTRLNTKCII